jgi:GABA(A) receptor-associated protein
MGFREQRTFDERKEEATRIIARHPDRVPVIVETHGDDLHLDKVKFLVPDTLTFSQLMFVIKRRMKVEPTVALNFLVNDTFPMPECSMHEVYGKHKDSDSFLYVSAVQSRVFGTMDVLADLVRPILSLF